MGDPRDSVYPGAHSPHRAPLRRPPQGPMEVQGHGDAPVQQ
jgi:hypothetical protein